MPLASTCLRYLFTAACLSTFTSIAQSDERPSSALFTDSIDPLLKQHCVSCHGPDAQEGKLRLDSLDAISRGGKSGPPIVPGKPDESLLITAVRRTDDTLQMPPEEKLPDAAVKLLVEWIQSGAVHPDGKIVIPPPAPPFDVEQARQFWAFQPVRRPQIPDLSQPEFVTSPIDAFVVSRLINHGLQPNPVADKSTLIRRATFDLTGLPPSPSEIAEFLADDSPDAFSKVINRLLDTQQYGERWGRHWLDIVRYADSNGLDENIAHGNAWRYRNYVINSLNADKPYDQFLREQIAGDLFIDETTDELTRIDRLTATGFLSLGPKVLAEGDETKMQLDIVDEQIDTMGRAMLGLTLGCARCHDHKFDPIAQADYYALAGIFQSTRTMESLKRIAKWNENSIATAADKANLADHQAKIEATKTEINSTLTVAAASAGNATAQQIPEDQLPEDVRAKLKALREELKQLEQSIPELPTAMGVVDGEVTNSRILMRGSHLSPGRTVERSVPVVLTADQQFTAAPGHSGRREMAEWLTSERNPLTARVFVNRVWRWHFGRGLVTTADNFGKLGDRPANPELLDWLTDEFIRNGWSLKALHRTIMLSRTWQLSSDENAAAEQLDPDNHLQWRWSTQRLEAESVRDAVLAVSGLLDRSMGESMLHVKNREFLFDHTSKDGTSYDSKRRSVYLPVIRNNLYDAMSLFDCTDGTVPNGDRASSTVASQALFLMNSDLVIQAAENLAGQLLAQFPDDARQRTELLFMRALGRPANGDDFSRFEQMAKKLDQQLAQDEIAEAERLKAVWTSLCQTLLMSNEFLYVK
jgi:cytochrome c553